MRRMLRANGILPVLVLALAACAPAGSGSGSEADDETATGSTAAAASMAAASGSPEASMSAAAGPDIDDLLEDPASFEGQEVTFDENVEEVLADGAAFSVTGTTVEGELLVVLAEAATVDKEIEVDRVVEITGSVVPIGELDNSGAQIGSDDDAISGYEGEYVIVADAIGDPLGGGADDSDDAGESDDAEASDEADDDSDDS